MIVLALYLLTLVIAPQLWIAPFVGVPTDFILYPLAFVSVLLTGRMPALLRMTTQDWVFLALVVWITFGALASGFSDEAREQVILYWKFLLLYKLFVALLGDAARARKLMGFLLVLVCILAVEAIQQLLSADGAGWADQGRAWIDPDVLAAGGVGRSRWIGIFDGPGVFCVLFTMTLPIALVRVGKENPKWVRAAAALVVMLLLVATYATGARGGFLAGLAVIGLFVMVRRKVSPRTIAIVVGLAVAAYSLAPAHLTTIRDQSNSTQYRVEMWAEGLDMVKEDPVLGIGRGNFQRYTGRLIAHNSAVQMGGETGLVGLFLWIALIYLSIRSCIQYGRAAADPGDKWFATGLALSVAGYLISAMFVTLEYETFYLLLAFCAVLGRSAPQPAPLGLARGDLIRIGAVEVGWLIGLQVFVIMYLG